MPLTPKEKRQHRAEVKEKRLASGIIPRPAGRAPHDDSGKPMRWDERAGTWMAPPSPIVPRPSPPAPTLALTISQPPAPPTPPDPPPAPRRECEAVLRLLEQGRQRRLEEQRAAEAAAAAAAAAAAREAEHAAAEAERSAAELAAAGLERISEANARRFEPPKLWILKPEQDGVAWRYGDDCFVHATRRLEKRAVSCCQPFGWENGFDKFFFFEADSAPARWWWQMTGLRGDLLPTAYQDNEFDAYEKLVRRWHDLAGLPPPPTYGGDHRGRGGRSMWTRERCLPFRPEDIPPNIPPWLIAARAADEAADREPPISDAALKRKRGQEREAQLEARQCKRLKEEREAARARLGETRDSCE